MSFLVPASASDNLLRLRCHTKRFSFSLPSRTGSSNLTSRPQPKSNHLHCGSLLLCQARFSSDCSQPSLRCCSSLLCSACPFRKLHCTDSNCQSSTRSLPLHSTDGLSMESPRRWPCNLPGSHPSSQVLYAADLFHTDCCNSSMRPSPTCNRKWHDKAALLLAPHSDAGNLTAFQLRSVRICFLHPTRIDLNMLAIHQFPRSIHRIDCRTVWQQGPRS